MFKAFLLEFGIPLHDENKNLIFLSNQVIAVSINNFLFHIHFISRLSTETAGQSYESILTNSQGFRNPNCIDHLSNAVGLNPLEFYTNMSSLRGKYPNEEYASELRQTQASNWAFR